MKTTQQVDETMLYQLLAKAYGYEAIPLEELQHQTTNRHFHRFNYWLDDQLVASVGGALIIDELSIFYLAVLPAFQGRGLAQQILSEFIAQLTDVKQVFLEVRESNTAAIHIYEKIGFKQNGLRPNYYHQPEESAITMSLNK